MYCDTSSLTTGTPLTAYRFPYGAISIHFVGRAVSAPLNPAYSVGEFQFYLQDTKPAILFIPTLKDTSGASNKAAQTALEAAKKENVTVYEMWLDNWAIKTRHVFGQMEGKGTYVVTEVGDPLPEDVALLLHTSGTTGR
jgi:long-subunit acyl-CoA synthetase (AMP-forming)